MVEPILGDNCADFVNAPVYDYGGPEILRSASNLNVVQAI